MKSLEKAPGSLGTSDERHWIRQSGTPPESVHTVPNPSFYWQHGKAAALQMDGATHVQTTLAVLIGS